MEFLKNIEDIEENVYNWYAVDTKMLAPLGWHVPTDSEWTQLGNYLIYNWNGDFLPSGVVAVTTMGILAI